MATKSKEKRKSQPKDTSIIHINEVMGIKGKRKDFSQYGTRRKKVPKGKERKFSDGEVTFKETIQKDNLALKSIKD
jgi:hypothetical protein